MPNAKTALSPSTEALHKVRERERPYGVEEGKSNRALGVQIIDFYFFYNTTNIQNNN